MMSARLLVVVYFCSFDVKQCRPLTHNWARIETNPQRNMMLTRKTYPFPKPKRILTKLAQKRSRFYQLPPQTRPTGALKSVQASVFVN